MSNTTVQGIDVSSDNGTVNWSEVKSSGKLFAFARAVYGVGVDTQFSTNWSGMAAAGLYGGAYQVYLNPQHDSVQDQINAFISAFGSEGYGSDSLPPVIDLETTSYGTTPLDEYTSGIQQWLESIQQWSSKVPMIYTTASFWNYTLQNPAGFENYPLWIANYGVSAPALPNGWTEYTFWQYSDTGSVSGVTGDCDLDQFYGSQKQLQSLASATVSGSSETASSSNGRHGLFHRG